MFWIQPWFRWAFRRSARAIVEGRYLDRARPEVGRFDRKDTEKLLERTLHHLDVLLPEAQLRRYRSLGNRQNVFLAVASVATYRALLEQGVDADYATELFGDLGWKIYLGATRPARLLARLITRDPQKQLNLMLRIWLRYPFNEPRSGPGYRRRVWSEPDRLCTDWTRCPAYEYVRDHGRAGELEFFRRTWCLYDFALPRALVEGGRYGREHTLSAGDSVCDMRWYTGGSQTS